MTEDQFNNEVEVGQKFAIVDLNGGFRSGSIIQIVEDNGQRIGFLVKLEIATDDPKAVGCYLPVTKDMAINTESERMQ